MAEIFENYFVSLKKGKDIFVFLSFFPFPGTAHTNNILYSSKVISTSFNTSQNHYVRNNIDHGIYYQLDKLCLLDL